VVAGATTLRGLRGRSSLWIPPGAPAARLGAHVHQRGPSSRGHSARLRTRDCFCSNISITSLIHHPAPASAHHLLLGKRHPHLLVVHLLCAGHPVFTDRVAAGANLRALRDARSLFWGIRVRMWLRRGDPPRIPYSLRQGSALSRERRDRSSRPWRRSCALPHLTRHERWYHTARVRIYNLLHA
jgi:hypothetical protein